MIRNTPINLETLCIDNVNIRDALKKSKQLTIREVPCILNMYGDGQVEMFEGGNAIRWVENILERFAPPPPPPIPLSRPPVDAGYDEPRERPERPREERPREERPREERPREERDEPKPRGGQKGSVRKGQSVPQFSEEEEEDDLMPLTPPQKKKKKKRNLVPITDIVEDEEGIKFRAAAERAEAQPKRQSAISSIAAQLASERDADESMVGGRRPMLS